MQDITQQDCISEGINRISHGREGDFYHWKNTTPNESNWADPVDAYADLWRSIYGEDAWNRNDWVWVIEFKRIDTKQVAA